MGGLIAVRPDLPPAPSGKPASMTAARRQAQSRLIRDAFYTMNTDWLRRMATSPAQLREKLTFFWHGHFACRVRRPEAAGQQQRTIRRLALDKFPDLLLAVSREPAMLRFLNNQQNRKQRPNENFARELLELFTLGRGRYTEADVKEAARAFTGWGYDGQNQFVFRQRQHDAGPKTLLGRTGTSLSGAERACRPPLTATLDLAPFQALIAHTPPAGLATVLLQVPLRPATLGLVAQAAASSPGQEFANLLDGDLRHQLDCRSLYATLPRDWLGADDEQILGQAYSRLPGLFQPISYGL